MTRRRRTRVVQAPLALASDGSLLVNAIHLTVTPTLDSVIAYAETTGLQVFIGVIVPRGLRGLVLRDVKDAADDLVGRLGPQLVRARRPRT